MGVTTKYVVAVVDDDDRVVQSLEDLLESAGYAVRSYSSAQSLLENDAGLTELDCLISDIGMPEIDGFELRRLAKAARPGLPVILVTGRHEISKPSLAHSDPTDEFFYKPFNGPDLLATIAKALATSPRNKRQ